MSTKVGKPIVVGDVLSRSTDLLLRTPALLIPQSIVLVLTLLGDIVSTSALSFLGIVVALVSFVVSVIVAGAYPSMVRAAVGGARFPVADALKQAYGRFWTLLAAGILVGLIVLLGLVALIVPGIIFVTWYAYTVPAIMLEEKGALAGMAASKSFGRDKKGSTFLIFVVILIVAIVIAVIQAVLSLGSPLLGRVVDSLLSVPLGAWVSVIFTYTYLAYGPSAVPATPDAPAYGMAPPPPPVQPPVLQPSPALGASPSRNFCSFCGSPVEPGSRFCASCGKPV